MAEFVDVIKKINKVCANNDCETCPYKSFMDCLSNPDLMRYIFDMVIYSTSLRCG